MAVTITGIGPTALRTFTFPDANAKILTNAAAVLVSEGGTGAASLTAHGVVIGEGTSAVAVTGAGTTGQVLRGVTGADPAFGAVNLTTDVTATLPVGNGGTGATTLAAHGVLIGEGASAVAATAAGTTGQALRSGGASVDPSFGEIVQTTTSTGTVNDFTLTAGAGVLRCNNATLLTITGIAAGFDGQRLVLVSVGAGQVDLSHQAAGSTAANRLINFATSGVTSLAAGVGTAELEYDATTARWRLITHEQGAWIAFTPTFSGTGATYGTQSGVYYLRGRMVTVNGYIALTAKGTSIGLITGLPFTSAAAPTFNAATIGQMNNMTTTWVSLNGYVAASGSGLQLVGRTAASATVVTVGNGDLSNTTDCMFSATYPV